MNLPLKAEVYCSDTFSGTTNHVILKPKSDEVTHIVVRLSLRDESLRIVPIEYLVGATAHSIELSCDFASLEAMPHFSLTSYTREAVPIFLGNGVFENAPVVTMKNYMTHTIHSEQVPEGEVVMGDHAYGGASDGHIGRVTSLIIDPKTHRISALILHEGTLWKHKMVKIPVEAVDFFDEDTIYLKWDKERLAELPPIEQEEYGR